MVSIEIIQGVACSRTILLTPSNPMPVLLSQKPFIRNVSETTCDVMKSHAAFMDMPYGVGKRDGGAASESADISYPTIKIKIVIQLKVILELKFS